MDGLLIKNGNLQIKKNRQISIQSDFTTEIRIDKKNVINYLPLLKDIKFINQETNFNANLDNFLNITFDKTFKVTDYVYTNKGKINKSYFKFDKPIKNSFLGKDINHLNRLITLSHLKEMSTKFHLINGAKLLQINKTTQNFEYKK